MASLLLASRTIPEIITFLRLAYYLGRRASPRRECTEDFFKENIGVPHIYQILNNRTLPTIGASTIIAQLVKVFQWIAFPQIETK